MFAGAPDACPMHVDPVCGHGGSRSAPWQRDFSNACRAMQEGASFTTSGYCRPVASVGLPPAPPRPSSLPVMYQRTVETPQEVTAGSVVDSLLAWADSPLMKIAGAIGTILAIRKVLR